MTDKERQINPRSLENLKLGAQARDQGKIRRNTTLLPETIAWLERQEGNLSATIDRLVAGVRNGKSSNTHNGIDQQVKSISKNMRDQIDQAELEAIREENAQLLKQLAEAREDLAASVAEANDYLDACERWQMVANHTGDQLTDVLNSPAAKKLDLEATRDHYLASLRLGKQAAEYKRTKAVIDRFIAILRQWN